MVAPLAAAAATFLSLATLASAVPVERSAASSLGRRWEYLKHFDLQAHRGGRGEVVEAVLPTFADALKTGVTTLEFDLGLTKDGHLIVWHDEVIDPTKCQDTQPAFAGDELFPYVGRNVANLTLAQVKTLDCGSIRIAGYPLQLDAPGSTLSTVDELFDFVQCATDEPILFNVETKVNPEVTNQTRSAEDFVDTFAPVLAARGENFIDRVTHQSFAWRSIAYSKEVAPTLRTSALVDDSTLYPAVNGIPANSSVHGTGRSLWLDLDIDSFPGNSTGERVAQAAHSIGADYLSPAALATGSVADPAVKNFVPFTTKEMVNKAHELGLRVAVWTVNGLNLLEHLVEDLGVDGIITDYSSHFRKWAIQQGKSLPPPGDAKRINQCLAKHHKTVAA